MGHFLFTVYIIFSFALLVWTGTIYYSITGDGLDSFHRGFFPKVHAFVERTRNTKVPFLILGGVFISWTILVNLGFTFIN